MKGARTLISVIELKRLMIDLKDKQANVCIRFRMLGEMWSDNFMRVVVVSDQAAILFDEANNRTNLVQDLSKVMQFELDSRFQDFKPHFHYDVTTSSEFPG